MIYGWLLPLIVVFVLFWMSIRIVRQYENGVLLRLGRYVSLRKPGLNFVVPFIDRLIVVDLRTIVRDVPSQDVITGDNVSVKVNAVLYFRIIHADKAVLQVEDFLYATSQLAQTSMRSILGQVTLDELLAERDKLNRQLQVILDRQTDPWGVKVSNVEIKHVDLPPDMTNAIARQAIAERERRAKIISAEGEFQAAEKLAMAADIIDAAPSALQLRYLQTLVDIANDSTQTVVFPVPIDIIGTFLSKSEGARLPEKPDSAEQPKVH